MEPFQHTVQYHETDKKGILRLKRDCPALHETLAALAAEQAGD